MICSNDDNRCRGKFFKIALLAIAGVAAVAWIVMLLWNWLLPDLFPGVRGIDYLQALGVLLLSKLLFGGFRGGHRGHWGHRRHWEGLTPEEREKLTHRCKSWRNGDDTTRADGNDGRQ